MTIQRLVRNDSFPKDKYEKNHSYYVNDEIWKRSNGARVNPHYHSIVQVGYWENTWFPFRGPYYDKGHSLNDALKEAQDQAKYHSSYAEDIFEGNKTARLLGRLVKLYHFSKITGLIKSLVTQRRKIPEVWLSYHFGIRPVIHSFNEFNREMKRVYEPKKVEVHRKVVYHPEYTDGHWKTWCELHVTDKVGFHCSAMPRNLVLETLGGYNPFETAWQLMPWSWAIDYFVNVSTVLRNMEAYDGNFRMYHTFHVKTRRFINIQANYEGDWGTNAHSIRTTSLPKYRITITNGLTVRRFSYLMSALSMSLKDHNDRLGLGKYWRKK